ncbi:MAG: CoA pyrophosphatase [Pirellulales bacterium]|nr:CoA pyrophosphatase [Pirellulales bacterium]
MAAHLVQQLADRLAEGDLLGRRGHARFEPELSFGRHSGPPPASARQGAVMLLLYPHDGEWHLPLTLRPETLSDHPGQISLPGGSVEDGETTYAAAVRELHEELDVDPSVVEPIGSLSPLYVFASNFLVTPWLAAAKCRPEFVENPHEVAEVLEVPLSQLMDVRSYGSHAYQRGSVSFRAPHIQWQRHRIWGATAMILGELIELLEGADRGVAHVET